MFDRLIAYLFRVVLDAIADLKETIMTSQAQLATQLQDLATQTEKARTEVLTKIGDLEAAIANAGNTTPEVDAALAALKGAVQGVDDIVPDAPAA